MDMTGTTRFGWGGPVSPDRHEGFCPNTDGTDCELPAGHDGEHTDAWGHTWANRKDDERLVE